MSLTGVARAAYRAVDDTIEGNSTVWNLFVSGWIKQQTHKVHQKMKLGNIKFDSCHAEPYVLLGMFQYAGQEINPNLTFTVDTKLFLNHVEFTLTPDLEDGTPYDLLLVDRCNYDAWMRSSNVTCRFD